jgi:ribose-phosphate pyrophosphokinase
MLQKQGYATDPTYSEKLVKLMNQQAAKTETAGTLVNAAKLMRDSGALSVRAAVSHALLNSMAYERLRVGHIDELITTDSIPVDTRGLPIKVLSVAGLLGEAIMRISNNESVTSLFKIKGF